MLGYHGGYVGSFSVGARRGLRSGLGKGLSEATEGPCVFACMCGRFDGYMRSAEISMMKAMMMDTSPANMEWEAGQRKHHYTTTHIYDTGLRLLPAN